MRYRDLAPEIADLLSYAISVTFYCSDRNGNSIKVALYIRAKDDSQLGRRSLMEITVELPNRSELSDMVSQYAWKKLHWLDLANYLDAHPEDLCGFPLWIRPKIVPAIRDYHTAREAEPQLQTA